MQMRTRILDRGPHLRALERPRDLTDEDYTVWARLLFRLSWRENGLMQWAMWSDYRDYDLMRWAQGVRASEDYGIEHRTMPLTAPCGAVAGDVLAFEKNHLRRLGKII